MGTGAEFSISNQFMVLHTTALGSKCLIPQFTHTTNCGGFTAHLGFQPNCNCDIPKELGEPHALSIEIIILREIVNISSRQWKHKTTSPPAGAVGAGKVGLQYLLLESEISNLEISGGFCLFVCFLLQNTVIQMQAFSIQSERRSPAGQLKHHYKTIYPPN